MGRYRVEVMMRGEWEGAWTDAQSERATFAEADELLAEVQLSILREFGDAVEGRIIDTSTGAVVHEHCPPRRVWTWN